MAAEHQHYVPQLLLRGFLSKIGEESHKEQVRVYDLERKECFPTSIQNIMGERRFNEWWVDDATLATIEPATAQIESQLAPLIEKIRAEKRILVNAETISDLALLMAFQFIRTKRMRLLPERLNAQLVAHVKRMGLDPAKVDGIVAWDKVSLKKEHVKQQVKNLTDFTAVMAEKIFFVMTASEGKSFYLGDHPVVLHSDEERSGVMRGLGIGTPYVQIYLPLSHDVLLCAYDRAVLGQLARSRDEEMNKGAAELLAMVVAGRMKPEQMKHLMGSVRAFDHVTPLIETIRAGLPVVCGDEQVDAYNSLQVFNAHRFVVDPAGKFDVVEEMIDERNASEQREKAGR